MNNKIKQIALAFSSGNFEECYEYISDTTKWNIFGEKELTGKVDIKKFCDQTAKYFSDVSTKFEMKNLVVGESCVAIDGSAVFINKENKKTVVCSCDVYKFGENNTIKEINSYCITTEKD